MLDILMFNHTNVSNTDMSEVTLCPIKERPVLVPDNQSPWEQVASSDGRHLVVGRVTQLDSRP